MLMDLHLFNTANCNFVKDLKVLSSCAFGEKRNISKSYTKGAMAVCISDVMKIGVDLEEKKKRSPETIKHFAKKFSTFQIKNIPIEVNDWWFYRSWTAMESYFKLSGAGFGTPKDFMLDMEQQSVWRNGRKVAWLEFFETGDFLICICSDTAFSKQDVRLNYHGWG